MNKQAPVIDDGNAGPGVAENMMSGLVRVEGDASQYAGATGHGGLLVIEGQCRLALRHLDEGYRHRRERQRSAIMSAFMAQARQSGRSRRRGRSAGRLALRGAALRARRGQEPRRRLHRERDCATSIRQLLGLLVEQAGVTGRVSDEFSRYGSARKLYNFHIDNAELIEEPTSSGHCDHTPPRKSATFDRLPLPKSAALRRRASTTSAAAARNARCRISTICCFLAHRCRAIRSKAIGSAAIRASCSGRALRRSPIELAIPITIAGMSFGALSAQAKEALGRGATAAGTSTTTGDGGMTRRSAANRRSSSINICPRATA